MKHKKTHFAAYFKIGHQTKNGKKKTRSLRKGNRNVSWFIPPLSLVFSGRSLISDQESVTNWTDSFLATHLSPISVYNLVKKHVCWRR